MNFKPVAIFFVISLMVVRPASADLVDGRFLESPSKNSVMDVTTGLIWMRCPIGELYRDSQCTGKRLVASRSQAFGFLNKNLPGWRLPTTKEFSSLAVCKTRWNGRPSEAHSNMRKYNTEKGFFDTWNDSDYPYSCGIDGIGVVSSLAFPIAWGNGIPGLDLFWSFNGPGPDREGRERHYAFNLKYKNPYFKTDLNCESHRCLGGPTVNALLPVMHESELKVPFVAGFDELPSKIPPTTLVWKGDGSSKDAFNKIEYDRPTPSVDRILTVVVGILTESDQKNIPLEPMEPSRSSFFGAAVVLEKGEFETTASFEERRKKEEINAKIKSEKEFNDAMTQYKELSNRRKKYIEEVGNNKVNPDFYRKKLLDAWGIVMPVMLGNPLLTNIRYDADREEFSAVLKGTSGSLEKEIRASVPLNRAEALKPDLVSGKIAPVVEFNYPEMSINWRLEDNEAQRIRRFADANMSITNLEVLIDEFPDKPEAKAARVRVFQLAKNSKELAGLIGRHSDWAEAKQAANQIYVMQAKEFREAQQRGSSYGWAEFIDNFGGADSKKFLESARKEKAAAEAREQREAKMAAEREERARPARNLCQAQVATCIASCPRDRVLTTLPDSQCKGRCESVSCN